MNSGDTSTEPVPVSDEMNTVLTHLTGLNEAALSELGTASAGTWYGGCYYEWDADIRGWRRIRCIA